jgi:hypothetical protein
MLLQRWLPVGWRAYRNLQASGQAGFCSMPDLESANFRV